MADRSQPLKFAAYGGAGWQPRKLALSAETNGIWGEFGINSEYGKLKAVLLHRPSDEIITNDPNMAQMLASLDLARAQAQHDAIADIYRAHAVTVHLTELQRQPSPNQMFMADLFTMTPEGAILARPASEVRAGEERVAAQNLATVGAPIVRSVSGRGTFEGADMLWLSPTHVIVGRGLRTNAVAIAQITTVLGEMGVRVTKVDLPVGSMHLMGMLRIVDHDLALGWPTRLAWAAADALKEEGYKLHFLPHLDEGLSGFAFNSVTLGPRKLFIAAGNPKTQAFYESLGITCVTTPVDELAKASGAIGCLTGIVAREMIE
ncbi:MAG TPA: amidinotransferase [Anaerolineae bacterium]|nr:amidinotransferase [Anaerolineae bacterium]